MTHSDEHEGKRRDISEAEGQSTIEADIMAGQVDTLKRMLFAINLPFVRVEQEVQVRDAGYYADKPTLGLLGLEENTLAVLASTGSEEDDVESDTPTTILIAPGSMEGSLKMDPVTKKPFADFFFVMEGRTIIPVKTTAPIPVDVLYPGFADYGFTGFDQETMLADIVSHDLTCIKGNTWGYMRKYEIPTPRGMLIQGTKEMRHQITKVARLEDVRGLVVKDPFAHQSKGVRLYPLSSEGVDGAVVFAREVAGRVGSVIIEERVDAAPIPFSPAAVGDWNVRSIAFVDGDNIAYVGAIIRYSRGSGEPVSISSGANTMPLPERSWLGQETRDFTEDAMRKIATAIRDYKGDPKGVFGLDIIFGGRQGDLHPVVIEPNGWHVGGISEICQMDGNTIDAVRERVIPALTPRVMRNFENRNGYGAVEDVAMSESDVRRVLGILIDQGKVDQAHAFLEVHEGKITNGKWWWALFTTLYDDGGNTEKALQCAEKFEAA